MGICRKCGVRTRFHLPLCTQHFYFDYERPRFWVAIMLTLLWEFVLNFPIYDKLDIDLLTVQALFQATHSGWFLLGIIVIQIIILVLSFKYFSRELYRCFL